MTKILIRSGKDPFTPVGAEASLTQDVINSNVGNYLFAHTVHRYLMTPGTELVSNGTLSETRPATPKDIARVNEEFDSFVIPLANAFRPEFANRLENLTSLVSGLRIPVVVVGVGAQAALDADPTATSDLDRTVRGFVAAVLERSASVGVRGDFTRDYLVRLGFPEDSVDVIGCPSLFLHGPDFRLAGRGPGLGPDARVALNVTNGVPGLGDLVERLMADHPDVTFIGQDRDDLRLLLWDETAHHPVDALLPLHREHPLQRAGAVRFPLDVWTWMDHLRGYDFAVGTRFHGNVAGLLAGIPSVLLAHDSRTAELAEYHRMPHRRVTDLRPGHTAAELYEEYDPRPFDEAYAGGLATYLAFLERNGLAHVGKSWGADTTYDDRVAAADFPPLVRPVGREPSEVASRLRWLRDGMAFDSTTHRQAYRAPFPHPAPRDQFTRAQRGKRRAEKRVRELERELRRTQKQLERSRATAQRQRGRLDRQAERLERQAGRLDRLEEQLGATYWQRLRRRVRRPD